MDRRYWPWLLARTSHADRASKLSPVPQIGEYDADGPCGSCAFLAYLRQFYRSRRLGLLDDLVHLHLGWGIPVTGALDAVVRLERVVQLDGFLLAILKDRVFGISQVTI